MSSVKTQHKAREIERTGVFQEILDIERRLRSIETELNLLSDKQRSHVRTRQRDARDTIDRGETIKLVIITPPEANNGTHAVSKYEGIYTFVEAGPIELHRGDLVRIRIMDVGDSHAEAIALERLRSEVAE